MVRKLNIVGDGQGDFSGDGGEQRAVFVYQMESYRYWEGVLGRSDFVFGQSEKTSARKLPITRAALAIGIHWRCDL